MQLSDIRQRTVILVQKVYALSRFNEFRYALSLTLPFNPFSPTFFLIAAK